MIYFQSYPLPQPLYCSILSNPLQNSFYVFLCLLKNSNLAFPPKRLSSVPPHSQATSVTSLSAPDTGPSVCIFLPFPHWTPLLPCSSSCFSAYFNHSNDMHPPASSSKLISNLTARVSSYMLQIVFCFQLDKSLSRDPLSFPTASLLLLLMLLLLSLPSLSCMSPSYKAVLLHLLHHHVCCQTLVRSVALSWLCLSCVGFLLSLRWWVWAWWVCMNWSVALCQPTRPSASGPLRLSWIFFRGSSQMPCVVSLRRS